MWMREKIAERLSLAMPTLRVAKATHYALVMIPLTEPDEDASEGERDIWEFACDRCGADCRGKDFHTGAVTVEPEGQRVTFTFGLCEACHKLEAATE